MGEGKGGQSPFTSVFTSVAAQIVTKCIFHSRSIECKIKELKILHLKTEKIGGNHCFFFLPHMDMKEVLLI